MLIHIEASTVLLNRIKASIELWDKHEGGNDCEIEAHVIKSLQVLNDGFVNMILSIQQDYIVQEKEYF